VTTTDTLDRVLAYFHMDPTGMYPPVARKLPVEIPNVGREDLAKLFGAIGFTVGVEVGVKQGEYSAVLCQHNPVLRLTCVDAWQAYHGYDEHAEQAALDRFLVEAQDRLRPFDCDFLRGFSVDAAATFDDGSLDFVYLDANHEFFHVAQDLTVWAPKVRVGGILAGHDFCKRMDQYGTNRYRVHVAEVVTAYTQAFHVAPWFLLGRKAIVDGETRDRPRSWFWVKS